MFSEKLKMLSRKGAKTQSRRKHSWIRGEISKFKSNIKNKTHP